MSTEEKTEILESVLNSKIARVAFSLLAAGILSAFTFSYTVNQKVAVLETRNEYDSRDMAELKSEVGSLRKELSENTAMIRELLASQRRSR